VGILEYLTAQALISRIAQASEELVRLASVDGERLTLVAKAQGARSGLLYDPDVGLDLRLSCSAAGQAWLMTLPEERAIACVTHQGLGEPRHYGPKAPTGIKALLKGWPRTASVASASSRMPMRPAVSWMEAPVRKGEGPTTGVLVIAGPSARLTLKRMQQLGLALVRTGGELSMSADASPLLKSATVGTWGNVAENG
jgi:IclR family transcriptional regulator, acetate operon repressor